MARMQTVEERMARNEDGHQLAAQAAESVLRVAEAAIQQGLYGVSACHVGANTNSGGVYWITQATGSVVPTIHWYDSTKVLTYTGPSLGNVPAPKFVIECLPPATLPGEAMGAGGGGGGGGSGAPVYRITVQAAGPDGNPSTLLQSIFRFQ